MRSNSDDRAVLKVGLERTPQVVVVDLMPLWQPEEAQEAEMVKRSEEEAMQAPVLDSVKCRAMKQFERRNCAHVWRSFFEPP